MQSERHISCIIPHYNEGTRLDAVLDEVTKVSNAFEVICIDDGSFLDRTRELRSKYPSIHFIRLDKNLGKTGAIKEGLKHAHGSFIALLDADLRYLNHKEIEDAISAVQHASDIDMLILRRVNAPFFVKLLRGDVLTTGERILKKSDLQEIVGAHVEGWQLESAINVYMYTRNKKVFWVSHSGINTHVKGGLLHEIRHHRTVLRDTITAAGPVNLIKIILYFGKAEFKLT